MKRIPLLFGFCGLSLVCGSKPSPKAPDAKPKQIHKIAVIETIQTSNYTYLHVKENDSVKWLAVPLMTASQGETYYYTGGWPMKDFESKELHRKFDQVLFLGSVSKDPNMSNNGNPHGNLPLNYDSTKPYKRTIAPESKKDIKVDMANGGISIAELYANKEIYSGKTVKIKGQVTKYTQQIMGKNWIHLQDGTEKNGKFELVITSLAEVKTGDIVTIEGKICLNKDFGYGYLFDLIMENAQLD